MSIWQTTASDESRQDQDPRSALPVIEPLLPLVGADLSVPTLSGSWVRYANLDIAASAPALQTVWQTVQELLPWYASVHRGAGFASQVCTDLLESSREDVAGFVGAPARRVGRIHPQHY